MTDPITADARLTRIEKALQNLATNLWVDNSRHLYMTGKMLTDDLYASLPTVPPAEIALDETFNKIHQFFTELCNTDNKLTYCIEPYNGAMIIAVGCGLSGGLAYDMRQMILKYGKRSGENT